MYHTGSLSGARMPQGGVEILPVCVEVIDMTLISVCSKALVSLTKF